MKQSHQLAIIAALGIGAYLLLRSGGAAAGTLRPVATTYPNGTAMQQPAAGSPAYAQWLAAQQQAQLDTAKVNALYGIGRMVNGWFTGSGSSGMPTPSSGSMGPAGDFGTGGGYTPPDMVAANTPFNEQYAVYTDNISGMPSLNSSDSAFIHSNDGYGFYTQ